MDIDIGNEIIARYLGWTIEVDERFAGHTRINVRNPEGSIVNSTTYTEIVPQEEQIQVAWRGATHKDYGRCVYDKSWDKLIPAAKKLLYDLEYYILHEDTDAAWVKECGNLSGYICEALLELDIEQVWEQVVSAINTINSK